MIDQRESWANLPMKMILNNSMLIRKLQSSEKSESGQKDTYIKDRNPGYIEMV